MATRLSRVAFRWACENPEFESFLRARSGNLLRTAVLLTGDYGHAEDMLQTALLRTLRQVLVNLCRDRRRRLLARQRGSLLLITENDLDQLWIRAPAVMRVACRCTDTTRARSGARWVSLCAITFSSSGVPPRGRAAADWDHLEPMVYEVDG